MDEKLARGYARELFRGLRKEDDVENGMRASIVKATFQVYRDGGGVTEQMVFDLARRVEAGFSATGRITTNLQCVPHPVRRRAILETSFPSSVVGDEQSWLTLRSGTYMFEKKTMKLIETAHHVAISQHAVFRLFQRHDAFDKQAPTAAMNKAALWVYPLLLAIGGSLARRPTLSGLHVAIPFLDGLLLGTVEICDLASPEQGPTVTTCRRGGCKIDKLKLAFAPEENALFIVSINTFVSKWELFDNQRSILGKLDQCERKFADTMDKLRRAVALGYPDSDAAKLAGLKPFTSSEVEEIFSISELVQTVFETPEWRQHAEAHRRPTRFLQ